MAYEKRTFLYEILIRFGPDGLTGAHVMDLEQVYDTDSDEVISEKQLDPRAIEPGEVGQYLGKGNAVALEKLVGKVNALSQERADFDEQCSDLDRRKTELANLAATLAADLSPSKPARRAG